SDVASMEQRGLRFCNYRYLLIACAAGITLISASSSHKDNGLRVEWNHARSQEELNTEKYTTRDTVLEADVSDHGHRFTLVPSQGRHAMDDSERFTLRIDFNVSYGRFWNKIFVEVNEINTSTKGIPFNNFRYSNMMPMAEDTRVVDIPIPKAYMQKWMSVPHAHIGFSFKLQFGMFSNVRKVNLKRPVMIFSRSSSPRCSEFTCCLSSTRFEIQENNQLYYNVIVPRTMRNQQCIHCSRVSEMREPRMDIFNLIIHSKMAVEDVKEPSQMGRCRATSWSSLPTTFVVANGDDEHAVIKDIPYFNAESCECVEDEVPLDYEAVQANNDEISIREAIQDARLKVTTPNP
ncbi:hypothetical protein PENTCL1PPCAC_28584, partial [Pristionchus entomophagus]